MAVKPPARPTASELAILRVLWERGPCTVRTVQTALGNDAGYTTVLKFMQIMAEKGLVSRDEAQRAHVYSARMPQEHTQRQLASDLVQRAFGGSATRFLMQLLHSGTTSEAEIADLRRMLDDFEARQKGGGA